METLWQFDNIKFRLCLLQFWKCSNLFDEVYMDRTEEMKTTGKLRVKICKILRLSSKSLFVCLFVWSSTSHSRIFHPYGDVIIIGEGLQILTYTRHSWPLSSEDSLACHTFSHFRETVPLCAFVSWAVTTCQGWYSNIQPFLMQCEISDRTRHRGSQNFCKCYINHTTFW